MISDASNRKVSTQAATGCERYLPPPGILVYTAFHRHPKVHVRSDFRSQALGRDHRHDWLVVEKSS